MDQNTSSERPDDKPDDKKSSESIGSFIWDLIKVFVISLLIIIPIRYYIGQPFIVSSISMNPTLYQGQYLIVDQLSYRLHQPQRGDIIVFKYPKDTTQYFIKRLIGLPGERVEIKDNHVYIYNSEHPNGFVLNEPYLPPGTITSADGGQASITLGKDEFYALGDNRPSSLDSRFWGPVPRNDMVGRAWVRIYPFNVATKFPHYDY